MKTFIVSAFVLLTLGTKAFATPNLYPYCENCDGGGSVVWIGVCNNGSDDITLFPLSHLKVIATHNVTHQQTVLVDSDWSNSARELDGMVIYHIQYCSMRTIQRCPTNYSCTAEVTADTTGIISESYEDDNFFSFVVSN